MLVLSIFFFSSRRRHTRYWRDWSSDVCSSDLTSWSPVIQPRSYGVLPLLNGTLLITGIALLVAVPLGLGAAIYLSEYARPRVRTTVQRSEEHTSELQSRPYIVCRLLLAKHHYN